jgi:Uma2 family endonuclease
MSALQAQSEIITLEQYENLPEDIRAEVFEGQIYYMAGPSQVHQTILLELSSALNAYVKNKKGGCRVFIAPFDVKLSTSPLLLVQPDIMIICDKDKLDGKRCNGAPDFIIEIVSPSNPSDDYIRKLYYYKNYGVQEYWIVDPTSQTVLVYIFEQDSFNVRQYSFQDKIKVNIYDDLWIDFAELEL